MNPASKGAILTEPSPLPKLRALPRSSWNSVILGLFGRSFEKFTKTCMLTAEFLVMWRKIMLSQADERYFPTSLTSVLHLDERAFESPMRSKPIKLRSGPSRIHAKQGMCSILPSRRYLAPDFTL